MTWCKSQGRKAPFSLAILTLALLSGCATVPGASPGTTASGPASTPMTFLLFGDHGYQLDYLKAKDKQPPLTLEQAIAAERVEWAEDKRPLDEFTPSAFVRLRETGGYVPASGMMPVAKAMTDYCRATRCDAGIMLGDNIYPDGATGGADGVDDAKRFDDILLTPFRNFGALAPAFRIYATLGNHDWRTSREAAMAQVDYMTNTSPFYMDGIAYSVKPPAGKGEVELFIIDTEVMLAGTTVYKAELADDGSELPPTEIEIPEPWTKPATESERNMAAWLEQALKASTARWKIVVGHHPLWSSAGSKFEQAKVMRRLILPTLCRYADMYVAGHEHTLEVHSDSCAAAIPGSNLAPLPQLVSGAAAKHRPLNTRFTAHQAKKSPELTTTYAKGVIWGYMHLTLNRDSAVVKVITTPNDGSGTNMVEHSQEFRRRSVN